MTNIAKEIGIQSYCYRYFKELPAFLDKLVASGVKATEICGIQVDFNKPETFDKAIETCNDYGVKILSIGVEWMSDNRAHEVKRFEFCKAAGVKFMSVSFPPGGMWKAFKAAHKLADKYDVNLAIHNHGGYDWMGTGTMLEYIFKHTGPRIGLCMDTAWAIDAKQNPVEWAEKFQDRLYGLHIKDFTYDKMRNPHDVVVGTGILDLKKLLSTLKKNKFGGYCVLEYEGDEKNPVPALKKCVAAVKKNA